MKFSKLLVSGLLAIGAFGAASAAELRFTATSTASGVLGYLDLDSSVLDGSGFQYVDNGLLIDLYFVDPILGTVVNTLGPTGQGTFFDSTGLPTVVGGSGETGGTTFADGVYIASTYYVYLAGSAFSDVVWSTSTVSAVPEPEQLALMLSGIGLLVVAARRRRQ